MDDYTDFVTTEMLSRRVTLDEHLEEGMRQVKKGNITQSLLDSIRADYEAKMLPGCEWWEWVCGSEVMMQSGGLALVRNGKIEWATQVWIS